MQAHQGKYTYQCEICLQGFNNNTRKLEHLTSHTNELYFACEVCCTKFKTKKQLDGHIAKNHSAAELAAAAIANCDDGDMTFENNGNL